MPVPGDGAAAFHRQEHQEKVTSMPFSCSICGEESTLICARCTKDACDNHLCPKCLRCSDCCECEVVLDERPEPVRPVVRAAAAPTPPPPEPEPEPQPEPSLEPAEQSLEPGPSLEQEPEPSLEHEPPFPEGGPVL